MLTCVITFGVYYRHMFRTLLNSFLERTMTELLNTLMNTNPIHLFLAVGTVLAVCSGGSNRVEEDDNSDYENASWNPSSVNYNG